MWDDNINSLLQNNASNHILPFLWVHGEEHGVYRNMIAAIYEAGIREFCVESRTHKRFGEQPWWDDMEVILSEAEKRGMRVWILDDKHFPTGYANGGVKKAPLELHRQHICHRQACVNGGRKVRLNISKRIAPRNRYNLMSWIMLLYSNHMRLPKKYKDGSLLSCTAWSAKETVDLMPHIRGGILLWDAPVGDWTIEVCSLSRNTGMHRSYINMLDGDSCSILIDEVYQPHYDRFKQRFGNTVAGFFSDEPELGNGNYLRFHNVLGTDQSLPYSADLARMLCARLGTEWKNLMPLLWTEGNSPAETARVRYIYMDCVTRLVEAAFSKQLGTWCYDHGVEYIGHVIEDNNQHARTATSLGHFFRGLKWQTMAGIDDIGGQVYPGGEDKMTKNLLGFYNDGEFYHYALGKLGTSLGAINPRMHGRTMCEIFGNYGWSEGVRLEKYLIDHFMVRGVNYFVPHAFTCKAYPDIDCPPHFYAQGHNPQYRHFGTLMAYANRICNLISGGRIDAPAAVLYHGEAEWSGKCMMMQKPARILWDNQIDFDFIPTDVFVEREFYRTQLSEELVVNGRPHRALVIPYAQFIPLELAQGIAELLEKGCHVAFIDALPDGICTGQPLPEAVGQSDVIGLDELLGYAQALGLRRVGLSPESNRVRVMHYLGEPELYYLFNEDGKAYSGTVTLLSVGGLYGYDAWHNRVLELEYVQNDKTCDVRVSLDPAKSLVVICGKPEGVTPYPPLKAEGKKIQLTCFTQSVCKSAHYPAFKGHRQIEKPRSYADTDKRFSGYIRYETVFNLGAYERTVLEITDAYEAVEVFVNGESAGIQVVPNFVFDITKLCEQGKNRLAIEVATTLERERGKTRKASPTGITGEVNLYIKH